MKKILTATCLCVFFIQCNKSPKVPHTIFDLSYQSSTGSTFSGSVLKKNTATVIFFFTPDCPLCQSYAATVNNIATQFKDEEISFLIIIPGDNYLQDSIIKFQKNYSLIPGVLMDYHFTTARLLGATVTPEAYVIDHTGKAVYSGAIDNWAVSLGQQRQVVTEFYVKDAINSVLQHQPVNITHTDPVGCFIEGIDKK